MRAKVIETGEIVNVTPYSIWYQENGQGPDRREWDEDELEFIPNPNRPIKISLDDACKWWEEELSYPTMTADEIKWYKEKVNSFRKAMEGKC